MACSTVRFIVSICDEKNSLYEDDLIEEENEYLTPKEVMNLLYIGKNTFYRLVNSGELPAFRIGKLWRVSTEELRAFLSASRADGQMGR